MKTGQILIDVELTMSSVALIEDGRLNEFYLEYKDSERLSGNIYKGRVENVLQGMETAFVNIGLGRNGFLYVGETLDDRSDLKKSGAIPSKLNIREGDYVMVQVTKEEIGLKGARLSMNLSLPGRYVVYLPNIDFVGVSNKITDQEKRNKLTKLLEKFRPQGGGLIARTACLDAKRADIIAEIKRMQTEYVNIRKRYDESDGISLVRSEGGLIYRSVRDMLSANIESIVCNDYGTVQRLKEDFKNLKSDFYGKVSYYQGGYDIWDVYGISDEVDKLLERKVALPSGGSLVIDHTEALTAVDVNTGKYVGKNNASHEETVYLTNLEAAKELARQLRLRNIGGIVVVDFIDMTDEGHKQAVVEALRNEVLHDRTKTRVHDMTDLGLVELTRKKVGNELSTILTQTCPYCKGSALSPSNDYVARKLKAAVNKLLAEQNVPNVLITVNADTMEYMFSSRYFSLLTENDWKNKRIYLIPSKTIKPLAFTVTGNTDDFISLPNGARLLY